MRRLIYTYPGVFVSQGFVRYGSSNISTDFWFVETYFPKPETTNLNPVQVPVVDIVYLDHYT